MKHLSYLNDAFDQLIQQYFNKEPQSLYSPIIYTLEAGGKRFRSLCMLYAFELFHQDIQKIILPSFGIELFHSFTLLHDDIMDHAPLRRGKPTVFKKYGLATAILTGDVMMTYAQKMITSVDSNVLSQVNQLFQQTAIEVCEGQQIDMDFEKREYVSVEEYLEMIRLKTSVLIACSLAIGGIVGGAHPKEIEALYSLGIDMGVAFQIQDDYLDSFGDSSQTGKQIGGDILENKKTILTTYVLNKNQQWKQEIQHWLSDTDIEPTKKIETILDIYNRSGAKTYTEDLIQTHYNRSRQILANFEKKNHTSQSLQHLLNQLVMRIQ